MAGAEAAAGVLLAVERALGRHRPGLAEQRQVAGDLESRIPGGLELLALERDLLVLLDVEELRRLAMYKKRPQHSCVDWHI